MSDKDEIQQFAERVAEKWIEGDTFRLLKGERQEFITLIANELRAGGWVNWNEDEDDIMTARKVLKEIADDPSCLIRLEPPYDIGTASLTSNIRLSQRANPDVEIGFISNT